MSEALRTIVLPHWKKDAGIDELIELLDNRKDACWDQETLRYRADFLRKSEYDLVVGEVVKCQQDFPYAARNYFKIVTKQSEDTPFSLWESQELVLERMYDIKAKGKPQKLMVIKARQLGLSTLIEALIAWRVMYFPNTAALVVADSRPNSAELFAKLLHIYDHLPWWLKPMLDRRKEEDLLKFDNPDHEARFKYPGLHSYVAVQPASSTQGVGQSRTLNACHLSEFPSWDESKAKEIIQEDIGNALAQNEDTFAFLEGTAKGVGKFSHKLWKRMVSLGEKASWVPIFLPWFFEKSRFLPPPGGWRPMQRWQDMRDRVKRDWVRCPSCGIYKEMAWGGVCLEDTICWNCNKARLQAVVLSDAQLFWMNDQWENNAFDSESKKILLQEMPVCITGDSRISTESGILRIDSADGLKSVETGPVSHWVNNGRRQVGELVTYHGRRLRLTPDHRVFITDGIELKAEELVEGDKIVLSAPRFADSYYTARWNVTPYLQASLKIDETFGRFLGYYMGDGCWAGGSVEVACNRQDQDVVEDVDRVMSSVSGKHCTREVRRGLEVVACSDTVGWTGILHGLGCLRKNCSPGRSESYKHKTRGYIRYVNVPDCIWASPRSVIREFLCALFECDGHAYRETPRTTFFTKWDQFARDIQLLLLGFGVNAKIVRETKINGQGRAFTGNAVNLTLEASNLFHKEVGFISNRKKTGACVRESRRKGYFHNEMADIFLSFTILGEEDVFDLTVPGVNRFGANGLLVHNSAEEAFQLSGVQVFPQECLEFIEKSLDKFAFLHGTMDSKGVYHAMVGPKNNRRCCVAGCMRDHQYEEHHLKVWEVPIPGASYVIGADVAEGLGGDADYSVAWVNRVGAFNTPDYHVATYRSNEIDPIQFGDLLNALGRWYNEALIALEVNKFDACLYRVRSFHMYPNNFRWKIPDATNPLTNRWGFYTNAKSKPRLWQTAVLFLKQRLWVIRDESFYEEALTFQKVSAEDRGAEAELGQNDDCVMAGMICLYCSHDADYNEDSVNGSMGPKMIGNGSDDSWEMSCDACGMTWMASAPDKYRRCPNTKAGPEKNKVCGSVALRGRNIMPGPTAPSVDLGVELNSPWAGETPVPTYDSL